MYFFRYKTPKQQLRERSLTQEQTLPYLIGIGILIGISGIIVPGSITNSYDALNGYAGIILFIIGTCYAYSENGGKSGFDFIQKYIIIGWVVTCRFVLVFIGILLVFGAILLIDGEDIFEMEDTDLFDVVLDGLISIIYYQRIGRHIRDTTQEE